MFKVICIDGVRIGDQSYNKDKKASVSDIVYEGEIYNVIGEYLYHGILFYFLQERGMRSAYYSKIFIPLSDMDEMELVNEK